MARTKNIEYIIDDKGRKKSVLMSYKTYKRLMEDIADLQAIADRRDEPAEDLEQVIAELKNAGRL